MVISYKHVNTDRTVYLISSEDGGDETSQQAWIRRNLKQLFESELEGWYIDPDL